MKVAFCGGFFLGIIGLIVVACKDRKSRYGVYVNVSDSEIISNGGWRCSKCGAVNPSYTGSCGCGNTKLEEENKAKAVLEFSKQKEKNENELLNLQKLKAYKDLLDSGAITQEEFDQKKAELLG